MERRAELHAAHARQSCFTVLRAGQVFPRAPFLCCRNILWLRSGVNTNMDENRPDATCKEVTLGIELNVTKDTSSTLWDCLSSRAMGWYPAHRPHLPVRPF
eukprot:scaffold3402_cov169-Amphora_coffeaeformis.AAC.17